MQGDDQVDGAGAAEVRRLPEPEDVPPEAMRRHVPGARRLRARAEHHGQGGVPVPEPGRGPRQAGRRGAGRRPVGTGAPAVLGHGRQLRAQRVRGRRVDRQVHVPTARGLTTAAAVNRSAPAATPTTGRPRLGRTVNGVLSVNHFFLFRFPIFRFYFLEVSPKAVHVAHTHSNIDTHTHTHAHSDTDTIILER